MDDDLNTTAPQSKPEEWKMPEPVFRRTSGKLPGAFEREVAKASAESETTPSDEPDVTQDEIPQGYSELEPAAGPKNSVVKLILVLLGLAAMVGFLIVFLTVIYFLFLRSE